METGFIKIRYTQESEWDDKDTSYQYSNTVGRYRYIKPGVKFILETRHYNVWHFIGHGVFGEITEEEGPDQNKTYYRVIYNQFNKCNLTPNTLGDRITEELGFAGPMAYTQSSILGISEATYEIAIDQMEQKQYQTSSFNEDDINWSNFQLWIISKFNKISENLGQSEAQTMKRFRDGFPYLSGLSQGDRPRKTILLPTLRWVNEDSLKDCWQPRRWGCVKNQDLIDKGRCELECPYSPNNSQEISCKNDYGAIWFRENRKTSFSSIYLEVLQDQILINKLDFNSFCQYITNRSGRVYPETKQWVINQFHLSKNELLAIFDLSDDQKIFVQLQTLSSLENRSLKNLEEKLQIVLYGPPGTGKTRTAKLIAQHIVHPSGKDNLMTVQFHPSYTYQDFVEGLFPESIDGVISYDFRDGHFKKICDMAKKNLEEKYCIIIDEINRANLPKVMGELFLALEYRGEENAIRLTSSPEEEFYVPENIYIIGTMNTADRSLADIDIALRRRFRFIEIIPDITVLEHHFGNEENKSRVKLILNMFTNINELLFDRLGNKDLLIGHSYYMLDDLEDNTIINMIFYELIPLVEEYFFQDRREIIDIFGEEMFVDLEKLQLMDPDKMDLDQYLQRYE